jgi:hypothetical protein
MTLLFALRLLFLLLLLVVVGWFGWAAFRREPR